MKDYKTITREKVDADPGAARYMSETHLLEEWSDKLLDLVLNGPALNGFRKDEIRAALRQTYTALKQYEQIGPMASPYMNDPSAIVARAFAELYPGIDEQARHYGLERQPGETDLELKKRIAFLKQAERRAGNR